MLLILEDFNDSLTVSSSTGNLDQILGHSLYHPIEVIYPLGSIVVFLLFGWSCYDEGRKYLVANQKRSRLGRYYFAFFVAIFYFALLALDDLDDISRILNLNLHLTLGYWYSLELLYPAGSILLFILFGRICLELGHRKPVLKPMKV